MAHIKVFMAVDANYNPRLTENQWNALFNQTGAKPLATAIRTAAVMAQEFITYHKRTQGTGVVRRATLVSWTMNEAHVDDLVAIAQAQAALRNITPANDADAVVRVIEAEIREAALDLNPAINASLITVPLSTYDEPEAANTTVKTYLQNNASVWYAAS